MARNCLLVILFGILACFAAVSVARVAIVGGKKANDNDFPYQVTLLHGGNDACGGGIIAEQYIITAAHCVVHMSGQFFNERRFLLIGTNDVNKRDGNAKVVRIQKFFVPKLYDSKPESSFADIAVLKLQEPLDLSKNHHLKKLDLPEHKDENYYGNVAKIAGFGWNQIKLYNGKEHGESTDGHLRYAEADVLNECNKRFFEKANSTTQLCARVKQPFSPFSSAKHGTCNGDSGGPLVHDNKVIGVLSTSPSSCSEKYRAAVYTKVAYFLDFVHHAMEDRHHADIRTHVTW